MRKHFTLVIFLLMYVNTIVYANNVKLYKHYTFGMTKNTIKKEVNVYDCSEEFEKGALCKNGELFVQENVDLGFRFINDKLVSVLVFTEFTSENYVKFFGALKSKFQLVTMESNQKKIDFIKQFKQYKKSSVLKNIADFEQNGLSIGNIKYVFIDKKTYLKFSRLSVNFTDLILKSTLNSRSVEYIITEDNNNTYGIIQFSAPKKSYELFNRKQKYDDF